MISLSIIRSNGMAAEDLCLACGMCCNGIIFADVQLQPGDKASELKHLGLRIISSRAKPNRETVTVGNVPAGKLKFCQPCTAFDGSKCKIYENRPAYCRGFECLLLNRFREGRTTGPAAMRQIRKAKAQAEQVWGLLRELGDTDEHLPAAARFRRTSERLEAIGMERDSARTYGELTVAVHELNVLLSTVFYPG